jgi:hypothetical protein
MPDYQGREVTATVQAPTEESLGILIQELNEYALETGMDPVVVLQSGPDPDGGFRAVLTAHNSNLISWIKEKASGLFPSKEEREFRQRQERGEIPVGALSPEELKRQEKARLEYSKSAAEAARKARSEQFKSQEELAKQQFKSTEEARLAEERAKILETEAYGQPLQAKFFAVKRDPKSYKITGVEDLGADLDMAQKRVGELRSSSPGSWSLVQGRGVVYDSSGRPIGIQGMPKGGAREFGAQVAKTTYETGMAQMRMTGTLAKAQEEELKNILAKRKREKILGPIKAVTREVEGVVTDVSRVAGSLGGPLKGPAYPRVPTSVPRLTQGPSLAHLRQTTVPGGGISPLAKPGGGPTKGRKSNYYEQMRRLRRMLF